MAIKIMQGDSYDIPVSVTQDDVTVTPEMVTDIEISVGSDIQKRYSNGEVYYGEDGQWYFRLSQEETFAMEDSYEVYVRAVYSGDPSDVVGVRAGAIIMQETGSTEVL